MVTVTRLPTTILDNPGSAKTIDNQEQTFEMASKRLTNRTILDIEGWKRVVPIPKFFEKYKVNIEDIELVAEFAYHPGNHKNLYSYDQALNDGHIIIVLIHYNWINNYKKDIAKSCSKPSNF